MHAAHERMGKLNHPRRISSSAFVLLYIFERDSLPVPPPCLRRFGQGRSRHTEFETLNPKPQNPKALNPKP